MKIICGDALTELKKLPDKLVQMCMTSPPYFGLRDYGTASWEGGDPACDHSSSNKPQSRDKLPPSLQDGSRFELFGKWRGTITQRNCVKCGATRVDSQVGLESTPEEYVAKLVEIFREVKRVLRDDGTLWLNLGDSYATEIGGRISPPETLAGAVHGKMPDGSKVNRGRHDGYTPNRDAKAIGRKHKDLIGIPWRVAFALQADGWYLRSDIIWSKNNPMPESVKDRPTKSHEYVFLFSKKAKYYYDSDAVKEPRVGTNLFPGNKAATVGPEGSSVSRRHPASAADRDDIRPWGDLDGRNLRSVWSIPTQPYKDAHFATFPVKLVETPVKAGTSEKGCCSKCGAPYERVIKKGETPHREKREYTLNVVPGRDKVSRLNSVDMEAIPVETVGWEPSCKCKKAKIVPCVVLDPFAGSGTVGVVCKHLGRKFIGIELNPEYIALAEKRIDPYKKEKAAIDKFFS